MEIQNQIDIISRQLSRHNSKETHDKIVNTLRALQLERKRREEVASDNFKK